MKNSKKIRIEVLLVLLLLSNSGLANVQKSLEFISSSKDFTEVVSGPGVKVDLKYASTDNFVGQDMYGEFDKAYLHQLAAAKLVKAEKNLQEINPKLKLLIFDALRPRSVQRLLWSKVKGTDKEKYVANPTSGSIHNYGFAVDLSIVDETGKQLDMGTKFDDFTELSQPKLEDKFLKEGLLTQRQVENRKMLRKVMEEAGFIQLPIEWWHFDALPRAQVKSGYKIVE